MDRLLIYTLLTLSIFIITIDIKKLYIPNFCNILFLIIIICLKGKEYQIIENSIIGMSVYSLPALFIYGYISDFFNKEVLGFGDIKLIWGIGYFFGYTNLVQIYFFYTLTFLLASIVSLPVCFFKKKKNLQIPMAPFILIAFGILNLWSNI